MAIDNAAGVLAAAESGEGGFWESTYPVIPHPGELIVGIISFAALYFIYKKYVVPRLETMLAERQKTIEGGIERAEAMQAEAKAALEQYRAQLAEARNEAAQIRDQARAEGQQILEEMRAQAREESERIVARGAEQIAASRQQVINELRGSIGALAVDLAGRVVGESLADDARRTGTVDRFLDELDGMSGSGAVAVPEGTR
ncbi:F0F1 ATP synthase subunit B [Blastococcus saxobsidens]|uniref:ATP synthase subunit b n=1 Tax=Blastococcus saxobsidens TaxID=138336 RepID=A0A6L9VZG7_9ACTN|nr:F0F1 ATP synthase subunit B [Blastococcus saxobsidens]NEK85193.1 F0F1 ATP synthase subunit B [Blastococcus saxobsidens]